MILNEVLIKWYYIQDYIIEYTVDDLGDSYYIVTILKMERNHSFNLKLILILWL